jgi:hypothetical protein
LPEDRWVSKYTNKNGTLYINDIPIGKVLYAELDMNDEIIEWETPYQYSKGKEVFKNTKEKKMKFTDIDGNEILRGDYILYTHKRLGLIYARVIYHTYYKLYIAPLHEKATQRKTSLRGNARFYLLPEDEVPQTVKELAGTYNRAGEWWL